ncbi:MAG: AAA family ATPase [Promethearchaeota archaeon]
MKVLAICGLPGSGKTTAIDAIRNLGSVITMGDVIRNEANKKNLAPTSENLGKIAKELRLNYGPNIIAEKCVDLINKQYNNIIFIDGLRSMAEVKVFRKYWKFPIIAIVLEEKRRFKRLFERARSDDPKSIDDLKDRDKREIEFGIEEVLNNADYTISNDSTKEDLKERIRKLVLDLIHNY